MTVTYDDIRWSYEDSRITYDGVILPATMSGDQAAPSGGVTSLGAFFRSLTGTQPAGIPGIYENPTVQYDQIGITYDGDISEVGVLFWQSVYHRLMFGDQAAPFGSSAWVWSPYIWAEYAWTIDNTMEETAYAMTVTNDDQVQYLHEQAHDDVSLEAEYTHRPVEPHTRP